MSICERVSRKEISTEIDKYFEIDDSDYAIIFGEEISTTKTVNRFMSLEDNDTDSTNVNIDKKESKYDSKQSSTINYFRTVHNNSNWCDYCYANIFFHEKSCKKFIDKCIKKFEKNQNSFFSYKDVHTLGTILSVENYARCYISTVCPVLFAHYDRLDNITSESREFITKGMIDHYIEKQFEAQKNSNAPTKDIDTWLIFTNERCGNCERIACPFHKNYGGFDLTNDLHKSSAKLLNNQRLYCCGWCLDTLSLI